MVAIWPKATAPGGADGPGSAVREAREAHNRAKKALEAAEAILLSRMIEAQVATYDYIDGDGGQWSLTLQLPEQPGLRVKYLGKYENE